MLKNSSKYYEEKEEVPVSIYENIEREIIVCTEEQAIRIIRICVHDTDTCSKFKKDIFWSFRQNSVQIS